MRTSTRKFIYLAVALLVPCVAIADDVEKLSSQNEYLISQVVDLRKKVKEYELAEGLLNQQLERERQRTAEESANVRVLSQQVVELKTGAKKLESGKAEADEQQKQLAESQARLTAEVSRLTGMVDDLTKQLQEKTNAQSKQSTDSKEVFEELETTKRQYSKVNADLLQCGSDKEAAATEIGKLNDQIKAAQSSLATSSDKDREIVRLKNEIMLKDSLLSGLGSKTASSNATAQPTNAQSTKPQQRAMQEKRDELFKRSGEVAGIETTGRKKINVPTGKGGDGIQLPIDPTATPPSDMETFGTVPGKGSSARGGTVDRAFEKLKENLERQRTNGEVTPGIQ